MRYKIIFILSWFLFISSKSFSQCRTFTKKNCLPQLQPYIFTGKYLGDVFVPGGAGEVEMTFQKGIQYKLFVCHQDVIKKVRFKVLDKDRKVIFDSMAEDVNFFEFKVNQTQDLIIQVFALAQNNPNELVPQGCVSIVVGYKK